MMGEIWSIAWEEECRKTVQCEIGLANDAVNDTKLPWCIRIRAMAIADDITRLRDAYAYKEDETISTYCAVLE